MLAVPLIFINALYPLTAQPSGCFINEIIVLINLIRCMWQCAKLHILNIPNFVSGMGALSDALRLSPSTRLVSAGSITPSSHNLQIV